MTHSDGDNAQVLTHRVMGSLLDAVVLALSTWTVTCYLCQLLGLSYRHLYLASPIPCLVTLWWLMAAPDRTPWAAETCDRIHVKPPWLFAGGAIAASVVTVYFVTESYVAFWVSAVVFVVGTLRMRPKMEWKLGSFNPREHIGVVMIVAVAAGALTLAAHRPDADDSFYLSLVVAAHDHPERQVLQEDDMYGEPGLPLVEEAYRLRSYEMMVAALSRGLRIPAKTLYYLVLPAFFAILSVVANWLALREIGGELAWLGTAVVFITLLAWGDSHPCFGNFAFVRLFQGKAILVSVFIPATVYYCSRFDRSRTRRSWLLLAAVQTAALGMSPSAIVVIPLTSAAFLIAAAPEARRMRAVGEGLLASALVVAAGSIAFVMMPIEGSAPTSIGEFFELTTSAKAGLDDVLGAGPRQTIAMFALLALPLVAPSSRRGRTLQRYVLVLLLLVMSPMLPGALGILTGRLTWRVFWAVPFPLILGLTAQCVAALWPSRHRVGIAVGLTIGAVFAAMPGLHTLSPENGTRLGLPTLKVDPGHAVARSIVDVTNDRDLVLAPVEVAQWIPTFPGHPRLVSIRQNYLFVLDAIGWEEVETRLMLMRSVTYDWFSPHLVPAAVAEVKQRGVTLVVVPTDLPLHDVFGDRLEGLGCRALSLSSSRGIRSYDAWRCPGR